MLDVFLTIDVEIWCDGWTNIDRKFPDAFEKYVYGPTPRGNYGLPYQLDVFGEHGLTTTCFVEPLFSTRFGNQPLQDIVGLVQERRHEVQLHLHTEWVDEALSSLLPDSHSKRQYLFLFDLDDQVKLISQGISLLRQAGAPEINAFRAGSFGFNDDTLRALARNGIRFDSSYNANMHGPESGVAPGTALVEPIEWAGVYEYPMTIFRDGIGHMRQAQLTSCSWREMESLLWQSVEAERKAFVILSHNFEILNPAKNRRDSVVDRRLQQLCRFLDRNRDVFRVRGFNDLEPKVTDNQPIPLQTGLIDTGIRMLEQAWRRKYE